MNNTGENKQNTQRQTAHGKAQARNECAARKSSEKAPIELRTARRRNSRKWQGKKMARDRGRAMPHDTHPHPPPHHPCQATILQLDCTLARRGVKRGPAARKRHSQCEGWYPVQVVGSLMKIACFQTPCCMRTHCVRTCACPDLPVHSGRSGIHLSNRPFSSLLPFLFVRRLMIRSL